jgi:outer membrane protein OmpA-like peptidoglycan-associated protein
MTTRTIHFSVKTPRPAIVPSAGKRTLIAAALVAVLGITACSTNPYTGEEEVSNTGKGAGIGAAGGAIAGAIISGSRRSTLLGLGIGALVGAGIGLYMDREEDKIRAKLKGTGVSVTRVGHQVILNMPGNVTFATSSANISSGFYPVLDSVALVINEYKKTYVDIIGYTDSTGPLDFNQRLSLQRAESVARYLESQKVLPERILTEGRGPANPVASNATPEGRARNRRVEITLTPLT